MGGRGGQSLKINNGDDVASAISGGVISNHTKLITKNSKAENQKNIANNIVFELSKEGFTGIQISTSVTDFGVSTYVIFTDEFGIERKIRISDHSVTNFNRVTNEYHLGQDRDIGKLVSRVKNDISLASIDNKKFLLRSAISAKRSEMLAVKWERIKKRFNGLTFNRNERTYQDLKEFSSKGNKSNIQQFVIGKSRDGRTIYAYEWTEPISSAFVPKLKPSLDYIEKL